MRFVCALALLLVVGTTVQGADATLCMSGRPCGGRCTGLFDSCVANQCVNSWGQVTGCYEPLWDLSSMWRPLWQPMPNSMRDWTWPTYTYTPPQQPTNPPPFTPPTMPTWFQPMQFPQMQFPKMPNMFDCGGKGPCASGEFCDASGICRADTCKARFEYGCPDDKGTLQKVNCLHNSGFKTCYQSTSGGFQCNKGPAGASVSCASATNGGTSTTISSSSPGGTGSASTSSGSFSGPAGSAVGGFVSSSSGMTANAPAAGATATAGASTGVPDASATPVVTEAAEAAASTSTTPAEPVPRVTTATTATPTETTVAPGGAITKTAEGGPQQISVTNQAVDGSAVSSGSAAGGEQQQVVTQTIPGGAMVTSTSSSGQPAATASAGASAGAGNLYTPFVAGSIGSSATTSAGSDAQPAATAQAGAQTDSSPAQAKFIGLPGSESSISAPKDAAAALVQTSNGGASSWSAWQRMRPCLLAVSIIVLCV